MARKRFGTIGGISFGALLAMMLLFAPHSCRAQEDPTAVLGAMVEAGVSQAEGFMQLIQLLEGAGDTWTEELWTNVVQLSTQIGLGIDDWVPTVSGCIRDEEGNPVIGAWVKAEAPTGIHPFSMCAITNAVSGRGRFGVCPLPVLEVDPLYIPQSFQNTYRQGGCYWLPAVGPGTLAMRINYGRLEPFYDAQVLITPYFPGLDMEPNTKGVWLKQDGTFAEYEMNWPSEASEGLGASGLPVVRSGQME